MKSQVIVAANLLLPPALAMQSALPSGTILPISLDASLNAAKLHVGQVFRSTVMQDIPGTLSKRRAKVLGRVVKPAPLKDGPAVLEISFDEIYLHGRAVPLKASLRALASFMELEAAQVPEEDASRGITPEVAMTQQIGGEQVYLGNQHQLFNERLGRRIHAPAKADFVARAASKGGKCHVPLPGNRPFRFTK